MVQSLTNNKLEIHLIPEYEKYRINVPQKEYERLRDSIKTDNQHYPIVMRKDGGVLDGHHRLRACNDLGIDVTYIIKEFPNKLLEEKFVIAANVFRRQLTPRQRLIAIRALIPIERELAKQRQQEAGKSFGKGKKNHRLRLTNHKLSRSDNTAEQHAASQLGKSRTWYTQAEFVDQHGNEQEKKLFDEDKKKVSSVVKLIKNRKAKEDAIKEHQEYPEVDPRSYTIINDDFKLHLPHMKNNSIDLIFTDPPYDEKSIHLYNDLAILAKDVLKPGGSLVTYCGQWALREILNMMYDNGLTYQWQFAVLLEGSFARHYPRKVVIKWKPLLWFSKGKPKNIDFISDLIDSTRASKVLHDWEQPIEDARHVIERLTLTGQTILDPMMGVGTTIIAARSLGRKAIGIEIEKETFDYASFNIKKKLAKLEAKIAGVIAN